MGKYLVTGGCGFIGSAVVNHLLERGADVVVMDNLSVGKDRWVGASRKPTLLIEDICDPAACDRVIGETKPDTLIDLAAHHFIPLCEDNPYAAYQLNVYGTLNVLSMHAAMACGTFFSLLPGTSILRTSCRTERSTR